MTIFVDSGVLFALHVADSPRQAPARAAFERVLSGEFGQPITSDYVVDEGATLVRSRTGDVDVAMGLVDRVRGCGSYPDVFTLTHIDPDDFRRAIDVFDRFADQPLSFTDATTIALVGGSDLDQVLAFDDDFDGIVDRLDPRDIV